MGMARNSSRTRELLVMLAAAALVPSVAAAAPDNVVLDEALALCATNHADPAAVLNLADSSGWERLTPWSPDLHASPLVRTKPIENGSFLVLKAREEIAGSREGRLDVRTCSVSADTRDAPGLVDAATVYLGRVPLFHVGPIVAWMYQSDPALGRLFLESSDETATRRALTRGPVITLSVGEGPVAMVIYKEVATSARAEASPSAR
jgi:hypothetical protein